MGSSGSKDVGTLENIFVSNIEDSFNFWRHSPEEVIGALTRFLSNGTLDRRAVLRAATYLSLRSIPALEDLCTLLGGGEDRVPAEPVIILGILLSSGTNTQKAEVLWDFFDRDANGEVQKATLELLFGALINASTALVAKSAKPNKEFSDNRLNKWREDLRVRAPKAVSSLVETIIGSNSAITRQDFLAAVSSKDIQFGTTQIRSYVEKVIYVAFSAGSAFARFKR
mmetsp:Transcript_3689/g.7887  ORF Transcript_3689/g.7887 Transcript_3689/m.7887 type:complete len:226 (+) Transcript_3689:840-1517(+)|eukprot:CAMPEP_0204915952 /NCGR_PEP_ID=MMETSP1397-20131031/13865_1 /ASSEMBLY_ACC=CAM_ASM_000891 /TAXON_ID=49980 /ORGANISM="Climacostomum Climacostomum virens, Strain Stock W-24" /LENGTH=225 /DNA_ID=CAMNT_0052088235 /DNA_START=118 /DNA_END=795 /DNA_ORIENTATION=+